MEISELNDKHDEYTINIDEWNLYEAAYKGTKALIDFGIIERLKGFVNAEGNPVDEPNELYKIRLKNIYGFALSERLIDVVLGYVNEKDTEYNFDTLESDKIFQLFLADSNKNGDDFEVTGEKHLLNSMIYGHTGIITTKGKVEGNRTTDTDYRDNLYPYITEFTPQSIHDWAYENINGTRELAMLKIYDADDRYNVWYKDSWEIFAIPDGAKEYELVDSGDNNLGYIPFTILRNGKKTGEMSGTSFIKEIARYDIALIRNEEASSRIVKYGAFPMLVLPKPKENDKNKAVIVAPSATLYSDPNKPNGNPFWLKSEVLAPVQACEIKRNSITLEAYKSIHASFMNDNGGGVESGEAKKRAFQSFNAMLSKIAKQIELYEYSIIKQWLDWQDDANLYESVQIGRPGDFDVSSLMDDIDELTAAKASVNSETFTQEIEKLIASKSMPELSIETEEKIHKEIEVKRPAIEDDIDKGIIE